MPLTETSLKALLGKHIRDICPNGYSSDSDNHCAHFVSHVLGYQFGATCRMMQGGTGTAACIRVQEVMLRCLQVGKWDELPTPLFWGLVFITRASNVNTKTKVMVNVPRKHIGIFIGGPRTIYHYSNSRRQVVSQTPDEFSNHYAAPDNAMFWGSAP
ncbi:MAG: hypothetical protein ABJF23_04870 [Bryobacteraceae bacterium]